ncbi:MAG: hypothetical protein Q9195_008907 [Heterodermia aff. obscurata]
MSAAVSNGVSNETSASNGISPKITLYTNHSCPWAHRAHITLRALNIPYEEVIIPLDRPREPWYLKVNPRGLVPSIKISNGVLEDEILTESAIVSTFIAELFPSPTFWPASHSTPTSALERARISFFVDTFIGKANGLWYPILRSEGEEKEKLGGELLQVIVKEIEPLLEDAKPFFGGKESLTLAEVYRPRGSDDEQWSARQLTIVQALTAPFVLRYQAFAEKGLLPKSVLNGLGALPNYSKWSKAIHEQDAATYIFDGPALADKTAERIAKQKAEGK